MLSIRPMRHFPIFAILVMAGSMAATAAGAASPGPVGRGTAGHAEGHALSGLAMTTLGPMFLRITRRRTVQ
jgi:hypothetical protein